jgi:hypothetical protein
MGLNAVMRGSLPVVTGPPATTSFRYPDINSIDSVVAEGSDSGSRYIYINTNNAYQSSGDSASINDDGTIAFFSNGVHGPVGIYTGDGISPPTLYTAFNATPPFILDVREPDINNDGLIAFRGVQSRPNIFVGPQHEPLLVNSRLFRRSISSSSVLGIDFHRGLNNRGQIAFSYVLDNGEKGIALATPRDPAVLGNGDFTNGLDLFTLIDSQSDGSASTPTVAGDPRLQMTTTNGILGLRQHMNTTSDPYLLQFDFDWLTAAGSLGVVVNDGLALTIGADGSISSPLGLPAVQSLGDLTRVSLMFTPVDLNDPLGGYIRFDLHPGSQATIQIDNISFAPVPELAGDYNHDGTVDAPDYVVWRKGLGTTYTQADYAVWRAHFGQTAGSGAGANASASGAVPEPTSRMMFILGMLVIVFRRRANAS